MNKSSFPTWLSGLCALLLAAVLALQLKESARLKALERQQADFGSALSGLRGRLSDQTEALQRRQADLATAVNQQTAVLHRALGKVIPVELPESLTRKLGALEARVTDEKAWPKDEADADAMLAELRDLVRQIPSWAEEDLLPRLNSLRWGVQSLQVLQASSTITGEALLAAIETTAEQLSRRPDGASTNITAKLEHAQKDLAERLDAYQRDEAIASAKRQLEISPMPDGLGVWQRLEAWTNSPTHGPQVDELRKRLRAKVLEDEVNAFCVSANANLQQLAGSKDDAFRRSGYARLLEAVLSQQFRFLEEQPNVSGAVTGQLARLSEAVEKQIRGEAEQQGREQADRVRKYQQWALQSIADFRVAMDAAMQRTKPGVVFGANSDPDFKGVADAIVQYLVPISPGHLDSAVAKIYSQAFEDGWNKLAGKDEKHLQTEVAQKDAVTAKKTPQNHLEKP